jgi:hypothetical protein
VADLARSNNGGIGAALAGLFVPTATTASRNHSSRLSVDDGHVRVPEHHVRQQSGKYIDQYIGNVSATDASARDADEDIKNQKFLENSVIKLRT